MRKTTLAALAVLALLAGPSGAAFNKGARGTSGAQFLKLAPGARPASMGEAFGGLADDVHAIHYNPAGLAFLDRVEVAAMHNSHFQGIDHNFGAISVPMLAWARERENPAELGVAAFSLTSLSVDDIERRGAVETDDPSGVFEASDLAYSLGYGLALSPEFALGIAAKAIDQEIDGVSARAFAADAGALYRRERFSLGVGARNAGTRVKFNSESDPLPLTVYAGGSVRLREEWLAAFEVRVPRDNTPRFSLGTEFRREFARNFTGSLRAGFNSANTDADGLNGITLGTGLGYGSLGFDFAWVPFGDLGNTFRYSLLVKF